MRVGSIDDIANRYVAEWAPLDPIGATFVGVAGQDDRLTDLSPEGYAALIDLDRRTLAQLAAATPESENERVAQEAMRERLGLSLERYDAGEITSEINVIASALHGVRGCFDLMPLDGEEAAANIAARMAAVPTALDQWRRTLLDAAAQGHVAPAKQITEVGKQCAVWADPQGDNFYLALAERAGAGVSEALQAELQRAADAARTATIAMGEFLQTELAPRGPEKEAAGRERYELASRYFLGAAIDLDETYAWGFEELARLESEMRHVADKIVADGSIDEAVAALNADPARRIDGKDEFREWMQDLASRTIEALNGTHFDIPEPVRRIEAMLAPTSDGGIYYTGPERGLLPSRAHVVGRAAGHQQLLDLAGGDHRLPRGRARSPPAGRADLCAGRPAQPLAAPAVVVFGTRRGLGALRRALDGRARILVRPG